MSDFRPVRPVSPMGAAKPSLDGVRPVYEGFSRRPVPVKPRVDTSRDGFCVAKENTCRARKAKGTDYCAGHLRSRGELDGGVGDEPTGTS